jgi:hypothetical protein
MYWQSVRIVIVSTAEGFKKNEYLFFYQFAFTLIWKGLFKKSFLLILDRDFFGIQSEKMYS